jgi:hypothetical protein
LAILTTGTPLAALLIVTVGVAGSTSTGLADNPLLRHQKNPNKNAKDLDLRMVFILYPFSFDLCACTEQAYIF